MLRNEKYRGIWTWNRNGYKRNPLTGKLRRYDKAKTEWDVKAFPDLRIIPDELWERVQTRLGEIKKTWPGGKGRSGFQGAHGNAMSTAIEKGPFVAIENSPPVDGQSFCS